LSPRITRFNAFENDPGQEKLFKSLTPAEREQCRDFIRAHDHLPLNEFAEVVNRWMIDQSKPKRYAVMWALVSQTNPVVIRRRRE
jgi:hypothetical protein